MFQSTHHKTQQTVVNGSSSLQPVPFLGMMLDNEGVFHRGNAGCESSREGKGRVAVSQNFFELYEPTGLSGRDDAQAVPPLSVIFLLQHILNTNEFFSAFFTVFAGIFPGGGSQVAFEYGDSHISTAVSIKSCGSSCTHAKSLHTVAQK